MMYSWHVRINHDSVRHNTHHLTYNKIVQLALQNEGFKTQWIGWLGDNILLAHHEKFNAMTLFLLSKNLQISVTELDRV